MSEKTRKTHWSPIGALLEPYWALSTKKLRVPTDTPDPSGHFLKIEGWGGAQLGNRRLDELKT